MPLDHFKTAALSYGIILACPLNAKNGPFQPVAKAMMGVWQDLIRRFRIDRERIYAAGFSGGARVASFLSQVIQQPVQGIIACGAGLSPAIKPDQLLAPLYFGLVGIADFNYQEMRRLDQTLDSTTVIHHIHYFSGGHRWPDQSLCTMAWQWMVVQTRRRGKSLVPEDKIQSIYTQFLQRIKKREKKGDVFYAAHEYRSLAAAFQGSPRLGSVDEKIKSLENSPQYKKFSKAERKRAKQEDVILRKAIGAFNRIKTALPGEVKIIHLANWIGLAKLKSQARKKDPYVQGFGQRILYNIANHAESEAKAQMNKNEYDRALLLIKLAINAGKEYYFHASLLYNMARIYAGKKMVKQAIKTLEKVKEMTPLDGDFLKTDPFMSNLLKEPGFLRLIQSLSKKADKNPLP